jgi:hypothetical protein
MTRYYMLDRQGSKLVASLEEWIDKFMGNTFVGVDEIGSERIPTVFLSQYDGPLPKHLLFETTIFEMAGTKAEAFHDVGRRQTAAQANLRQSARAK